MRALTPKSKAKVEEIERPDVEIHDEIYFRHETGPLVGKVRAVGKHGCHVDVGGKLQRVRWEHLLGHKVKVNTQAKIVDQGEDGMILQSPEGTRRYVHDPVGPKPPKLKEPMHKAFPPPPRLLLFAPRAELMKALGPTKGRPGLTLQPVTDKRGVATKRWKSSGGKEPPKDPTPAAPERESAGSAKGYGTHDLDIGDTIEFKAGDFVGKGKITHMGADGATVEDSSGRAHGVHWAEITGHGSKAGDGPDLEKPEPSSTSTPPKTPPKKTAEAFGAHGAHEHNQLHDDPNATDEDAFSHFPPEARSKAEGSTKRLKSVEDTIKTHKKNGEYTAARRALHQKILYDGFKVRGKFYPGILSPERVEAATPKPGEQPTFTILGGRGGSGKSAFNGEKHPEAKVYDKNAAIVLDNDKIKEILPEYEGWNAAQVHEEASDVFDEALRLASERGLNIVQDATMKTPAKAVAVVKKFRDMGYRVEAHYMYLPRQEAAKRAIERFLGKTERFVPPHVVLENTENEKAFDAVRPLTHKWSFRDNNVPEGTAPTLISEGENEHLG